MARVNPRDFLLNTDYEMDKIVFFTQGEIEAGQNRYIPHSLGFYPLVFGVCATSSDFSDARALPYLFFPGGADFQFSLFANKTNVEISYGSNEPSAPKMYYRIFAFEPSDSRAKIGATSKHAKNFILNTDYNYCKLRSKGFVTGDGTIAHNLGYIPQVMIWLENDGNNWITPIENGSLNQPSGLTARNAQVTPTEVIFTGFGSGNIKLHYRIYYDEA